LDQIDINGVVEHALACPLDGDVEGFADAVSTANSILYLADNAGEIVLDRLLIERLPIEKLTVAVRGVPVINDATMTDARDAGITELVTVIDNGSDVPGTMLEACSASFRSQFDEADLIISKGVGNFETLNDVEKRMFFLLKVKCSVIAEELGVEVGSLVLHASKYMKESITEESLFALV